MQLQDRVTIITDLTRPYIDNHTPTDDKVTKERCWAHTDNKWNTEETRCTQTTIQTDTNTHRYKHKYKDNHRQRRYTQKHRYTHRYTDEK